MRIGELAQQSETSIPTLRFYEREGMLRCPPRTAAGYRVYSNADLEQVRFIRRCQALGFSLDDIQQLSAMHGMAPSACPDPGQVRRQFLDLSRRRLEFLDGRIAGLKTLRRQIAALLRAAERAPSGCPAAKK